MSDDAKSRLRVKKFDYLHECVEYVHDVLKASICGVEIVDSARDLEDDPFDGDTAIMMGNEGSGMNQKQINACDYFVRIAQYGGGKQPLVNTLIASARATPVLLPWAPVPRAGPTGICSLWMSL